MFQLDLLREVGFETVDVLHKNSAFAAFVAALRAIGLQQRRCAAGILTEPGESRR